MYAGAAAAGLGLANRYVRRLPGVAAFFLAAAPLLFTGRAMLTGAVYAPIDIAYQTDPLRAKASDLGVLPPRTAPLGDVVYQEIPWRAAVREAILRGQAPLWNRFVLAGEPLLAAQQPAALHPATWLGLLLPLPQAWTFEMSFRLFLALASMYLLLRDWRCGDAAALFGSAAWAFCDYLMFYLGYPLGPAAAPFPLLLLGLRRLAEEPGRRALGVTVAALFLVVTAGHPESILHVTAAAGVVFLFELAWTNRERRVPAVAFALAAGALALGLCAAILLPFREAVPHTIEYALRSGAYAHARRSLPLAASLARSISDLVPFGPGVWEPSAYAGSILFPLAVAGAVSRRRERWPLLLLAGIGLAAFGRVPWIHDAICRLPLFDVAINERLAFVAAFALAALAAFGAERLGRGEARGTALAGAIATAAAILLLIRLVPAAGRTPWAGPSQVRAREVTPLVVLAIAAALAGARPRLARVLPAALVGLLLGQRVREAESFYPTISAKAFYPPLSVLARAPRDQPWRFAGVGHEFVPNVAALYGLEDVRGYEAMTFAPLAETFPLWCVPQPVWYNRVDDPSRPFLSFLNVRYVLAPPGSPPPAGWNVLSDEPGGRLLENPGALPRVFVPRRIHRETDPARQRQLLFAISDFRRDGVLEAPLSGETDNGEASVRIVSYDPQTMELAIDAAAPAVVGTSITAWPGWRLELDGRAAPLARYNRAFLAFETSAGTHRGTLRYRPDSFVAGAWISAISLAVCLALLALPGR